MALGPAQHRPGGCAVVLEDQLARLHALVAQLGQVLGDGQPRSVLDEQDRDALVPGPRVRVGLAQQRDQSRPARVADPGLGPVDHVGVAVPAGGGLHRLQVRAATRLGERHRGADLAGGHLRQVPVLLLPGAERQQQLGHHGVAAHRPGQAHPAAGQLRGDQRVARHRHRGLTPGLGNGQPVDAHLLHLLDELPRVGIGVLHVPDHGPHLAVHPIRDGLDDRLFLGAQHRGSPFFFSCPYLPA